jgi:hypothetical protein
MKAICIQTTSEGFDLHEVTTVFSNDFDYNYGGYGIELGKEYTIMGIVLYNDSNCLYYLIDVNGRPDWFPYLLFEISDNSLPRNWFIKLNGKMKSSDINCLWGFEELCNVQDFYHQLIEREETAMRIYFRRKIEIEKEYEI